MTWRKRVAGWFDPPAPVVVDDVPKRIAMTVSTQARLLAMTKPATLEPELADVFARPKPPAGVMPAMAMDNLPAVQPIANWAVEQIFHEGLAFPGYSYLAQLAQRAEYRHMAEIYAEHATRRWIKLRGKNEDRLGQIEAEMKRLDVRGVFRRAAEVDGAMGRCQVYLDFGNSERAQPLLSDPRKVNANRPLKRLAIVEPMWCYPGTYEASNPLHPDFYQPRFWFVQGNPVSNTRFLTFVGREMPDLLKPAYAFGGLSLTQMAKPYVDNWLRTRQSVSDITAAFSQMVLATDMGATLAGGTGSDLFDRVDLFNQTRDNRGTMVINKDTEELTNVTTPLSSLDKLQAQAQEHMSAVARIPLSILLQVTPTGLNASSEGEIRSFYADVKAYQEKVFRPNYQRVLELVQLSLDGVIDPDVTFEFEPLWEMSAVDAATTRKTQADTDAVYVTMGAVSNDEVREKLREEEGGPFEGVNLAGDAPEPEGDDGDAPAPDDDA